MATGTMKWFTPSLLGVFNATVDLANDTIKAQLTTRTFSADQDGGVSYAVHVAPNAVGDAGVVDTRLNSPGAHSARANELNNSVAITGDITGARSVVFYDETASNAVLLFADFSGPVDSNSGTFTLNWNPNAMVMIAV